jgi:hypothetical protein
LSSSVPDQVIAVDPDAKSPRSARIAELREYLESLALTAGDRVNVLAIIAAYESGELEANSKGHRTFWCGGVQKTRLMKDGDNGWVKHVKQWKSEEGPDSIIWSERVSFLDCGYLIEGKDRKFYLKRHYQPRVLRLSDSRPRFRNHPGNIV